MKVNITAGTGTGPTELAAFDHALLNAGTANFNLIYLSSVLPADSDVIVHEKPLSPIGNWGDRLYVVMAQQRTSQRNKEVWAGIGWIQEKNNGRGLMVEHEGFNESEVREDIKQSLEALAKNRGVEFGPVHMKVIGTKCIDTPVCALVVAAFKATGWQSKLNTPYQLSNILKLNKK